MEIIIEQNRDNNLFEEVVFYNGMLGNFSYNPREFCITFSNIKDRYTDVLRYIGNANEIHIPQGVIAIPYLLKEGYDDFDNITIVNHSNNLIDMDYMLYKTKVRNVSFEGFDSPVNIQTAESAFEGSYLEQIDIHTINLSNCKNMIRMFANTRLKQIDLKDINLKNDLDVRSMFENCELLEQVEWINNGSDSGLELTMDAMFKNCNRLKDWIIYDADTFVVNDYTGELSCVISKESLLYRNVNAFLQAFVPEFNDKIGIQLNEAFDIKVLNEYVTLLMKSTAKDLINNMKFIFRLLQEVRIDTFGKMDEIAQVHFVNSIEAEMERRSYQENPKSAVMVQSRSLVDRDIIVYALYYEMLLKGYRIKYHNMYYDITATEYLQLGLMNILPRKKLKLNVDGNEYYVNQVCGETIKIYGYNELEDELRK